MELIPRDYQLEARDAALAGNKIINLPTGAGKTLIAALIIEAKRPKYTICVVNSVAIIEQHMNFFHSRGIHNIIVDTAAGLKGRIFDFSGLEESIDDDFFDENGKMREVSAAKRAYVNSKIRDIECVVFDECHHAIGHHPYVQLSNLLHQYKPDMLRIGLTASFVHGAFENISKKRQRLEDNLMCQLWTPSKSESMATLGSNPDKHFYKVDYASPKYVLSAKDIEKRTFELINPALKNCPYGLANTIRKEIEKSAYLCYFTLGEAGWSFFMRDGLIPFIEAKLKQKAEYVIKEAKDQDDLNLVWYRQNGYRDEEDYYKQKGWDYDQVKATKAMQIENKNSVEDMENQRFMYLIPVLHFLQEKIPVINQVSPKVDSLIEILESCTSDAVVRNMHAFNDDPFGLGINNVVDPFTVVQEMDQSLVFVERAILCIPLAKIIELRTKRSCKPVMGVQSMNADTRNATLSDFKRGNTRVIVATSSLEEGIDVADCKVVVRFDYFSSVRSHIQGSGRARHKDAKIFYFEQEPEVEEQKAKLINIAARDKSVEIPDIPAQNKPHSTVVDTAGNDAYNIFLEKKKTTEDVPLPYEARVREYPSLEVCGVGHSFDGKEETVWNHISNKSERVIKCRTCRSQVVVKSRAYGKGRKKKERIYCYGGADNDWVCPDASSEALAKAKAENMMSPPEGPIVSLKKEDVTEESVSHGKSNVSCTPESSSVSASPDSSARHSGKGGDVVSSDVVGGKGSGVRPPPGL